MQIRYMCVCLRFNTMPQCDKLICKCLHVDASDDWQCTHTHSETHLLGHIHSLYLSSEKRKYIAVAADTRALPLVCADWSCPDVQMLTTVIGGGCFAFTYFPLQPKRRQPLCHRCQSIRPITSVSYHCSVGSTSASSTFTHRCSIPLSALKIAPSSEINPILQWVREHMSHEAPRHHHSAVHLNEYKTNTCGNTAAAPEEKTWSSDH